MEFCSAHSWTCPSAWRRLHPSRLCPGRPCWWCWSQPWRRRRWWARGRPPPVLPFDFHSLWRCWAARQMLETRRKGKTKQNQLDFFFFCCCDRCMSEAACTPCQMTELTQIVWAAAGSAWVNISWGPGWIGQQSEFRTKPLSHCLNPRLTSQSEDKIIIYYSHAVKTVNLSSAGSIRNCAFTGKLKMCYDFNLTPSSLYTTGVFTLHTGVLWTDRRQRCVSKVNCSFVCVCKSMYLHMYCVTSEHVNHHLTHRRRTTAGTCINKTLKTLRYYKYHNYNIEVLSLPLFLLV